MKFRSSIFILLLSLGLFYCAEETRQMPDPLPSWNDGKAKQAVIDFVKTVTDNSSPNYVEPADRIAVFDNDGTLWSERPYYFQLQFALDRIQDMAEDHPEWKTNKLLNAVINDDIQTVMDAGVSGLIEIVMYSHSGMTTDEFEQIVKEWMDEARHPRTKRLYKEMVFQPMLEILEYLRENNFKTYIVSGGGIEFMRPWAEEVYGIPREQIIGSSIKTKYEMTDKGPVIRRLAELDFINDKEAKPLAINKIIGKRPIAAFGNSDGDLQMLQWTAAGKGNSFMMYVHHTDAEREWSYDRDSHVGRLDKGLDEAEAKGWTLVDMKNDWNKIYPDIKD